MKERKERSVQITVAIIGCLGTIFVAIITGIFSLLTISLSRTPEVTPPTVMATTISNPVVVVPSPSQPTSLAQIPVDTVTTDQINVSGIWSGYLTYLLGDSVTNFNYRLELSQDGIVITGKSRIEQIENVDNFAEYYLGAQLLADQGHVILKIDETDLSNSNNYMNFLFTETVAAKEMALNYVIKQGKEMLEGEWWSYGIDQSPDGRVQLTRQP